MNKDYFGKSGYYLNMSKTLNIYLHKKLLPRKVIGEIMYTNPLQIFSTTAMTTYCIGFYKDVEKNIFISVNSPDSINNIKMFSTTAMTTYCLGFYIKIIFLFQ